ncbi:MAG TPA: sigma-70 family RNA polymerase sigma factor [Candidatus Bathyarchaeia archaeon]|nr:sigma-70 family RNA polymerase sigma factor [Candidatus Bathyarchaeia archaeon]
MHSGDATLLERWRDSGDAQAFAEVAGRYAGLVYATCRRVLGNDTDAEDAAQECFLSLAQKAPRRRQPLGPWLYVVATNHAINRRKSQLRRVAREQRYAKELAAPAEPGWEDVQQYVDEAIAALPEKLRQPIVLHFLEGRSLVAVAEALGLSRTTVNVRIARGIESTRKHLRRRGISVGAAVLAGMLAGKSAMAAPAALTAALGRLALAGSRGATGGAAALAASGGLLKLAVAGGVLILIAAVVSVAAVKRGGLPAAPGAPRVAASAPDSAQQGVKPVTTSAPAHDTSAARKTGQAANASATGLVGSVVDQGGQPVADADVVVGVGHDATANVKTDATGQFRFEALPEGTFVLHAFKSGVGLASRADVGAEGDVGELALEPMASISGRVYDNSTGDPIPDFPMTLGEFAFGQFRTEINLQQTAWHMLEVFHDNRAAKTDAAGQYQFVDLFPVKCFFQCVQNATDYVFPGYREPPKEVTLRSGQMMTGVDFRLERGGSISGTVYEGRDVPLADARVCLMPWPNYFNYEELKTQEDGRYQFRGLPTEPTYTVLAKHEDFAFKTSAPVTLADLNGVDGVDVHLGAGNRLEGLLRDEAGSPITGAEVCFYGGRGERAKSATNGRFSFAHVEPGEYTLWIYKKDVNYATPEFDFTMPAHNLTDLVVTLNRNSPGVVSGRVVDSSGKPVGGVRVTASSYPEERPVNEETQTGDDGRFAFTSLGDVTKCTVTAYPNGYQWARQDAVAVGATDVELVVYGFGTVAGRVIDAATGEPVTEYRVRHVRLYPTPEGVAEYKSEWTPVNSEDGAFVLDKVAPPAVRLDVSAKGYAPEQTARLEMPEGGSIQDVVVKLSRGAKLTGRVVEERTGAAVPSARLCAYAPPYFNPRVLREDSRDTLGYATCVDAKTDNEGQFKLDPLTPGETVGLVAWHEGYGTQILPALVAGNTGPVTIRLAPEGRLVVQLLNPEALGEPVSTVCRQANADAGAQAYNAWDGPDWRGLPAGPYEIMMRTRDRGQLGIVSAVVTAGEMTEVTVDLAELPNMFGTIYGTVEMEGAWLQVTPADSGQINYAQTGCDETGEFRMGGLPPGEYDVKAHRFLDEQYYEGTARVLVEAGQEHEVQISLEPAVHPALR